MVQVSVMGAGSWGTTLAKVFADAGNPVRLWSRRAEQAQRIQISRENHDYLPGLGLPRNIEATSDAEAALTGADVVVLGVPSQTLRDNLKVWKDFIGPETILLSLAKGVERETHLRMSEVIAEVTDLPAERIAVLSGPNLAREVAMEQPAATVIACADENNAKMIQAAVATNYFRPYTNTDVIGCEIGGACKNVIALACGMASGQGLGENTLATIITRGLAEITRLGDAVGAEDKTFAGLAGLGDLVATCSSPLSRNRTFGDRLGRGDTMEQAQHATRGQVAEGVISSISVRDLARRNGVEMPITEAVYAVCHEGAKVDETIRKLMGRSRKSE
ncbi:NAD(P)H-dependent glycerol-3-phosphate dehydrogenase [Corynebacterium amycolatum]|uniref:NAD(P)H-dependent glycerol-3-phosphate dehydrogenase n=1 Tax=Corynebacterium amycolatum TaxID=43765 RepID=UPI000E1AB627|nr:NAD(P)H-dependent glycerol-3-phosphate dehydrogenase [Corynebacterium amycolatum]MCQ9128790.1 NAD(P)-dependent glycerol-3-phosphate dehydrogenase [Corynebacterium amycolatum]MCQ9142532.1 NAD(P)-dependent glycerol-3-phosphate dehydrogenase [Corynebacterium amycolatum]STB93895.1 NAD(P)H-dependent glycerol-3-phosphate dehydrogenase [Corynebacterium amycolatum]